jgi:hypothetical protein
MTRITIRFIMYFDSQDSRRQIRPTMVRTEKQTTRIAQITGAVRNANAKKSVSTRTEVFGQTSNC